MNPREPFFSGLVFNELGEPVESTTVGDEPFYAISDGDFKRHVEAAQVDRQVLIQMKEVILGMKDMVLDSVLQMIGSDDPFTRAAIENNLENMERILDMEEQAPNLEDMRLWLWMTGFRVTVDVHGEVLQVELPGMESPP
jgi:hypothetical protein